MCQGVLRLSFPDAEVPSDLHLETSLVSREQAMEIWTFTEKHISKIERVIVHCDAGVSSSDASRTSARARRSPSGRSCQTPLTGRLPSGGGQLPRRGGPLRFRRILVPVYRKPP